MSTRTLASTLIVAMLAAACSSDLPHSNPYDPQAPETVQAKARLVGTVSLETTGGAVDLSGVRVVVAGLGLETSSLPDGSWAVAEVPPGTYTVEAFKDGYVQDSVSGLVVELSGGDVQVPQLALRRARGALRGQAALEGEESFGGISVLLSAAAGMAQTDPQGNFVLSGVPTGTYEVTLSKLAFHDVKLANVVVSPDATAELEPVTLASNPGSISGRVRVRGAPNNAGVLITADGTTLSGRRNVLQVTTTLDPTGAVPDGSFTLSNVAAGLYSVSFTLENHFALPATVSVSPEVEIVLPLIELQVETGVATGTVTLENALDHSGIQVTLTPEPTAANPSPAVAGVALTSGIGAWRLEGVPVGRYDVSYSKRPGYEDGSGELTVGRDVTAVAADVVLAEIPGTIEGRVLLEGVDPAADLSGTLVAVDTGPARTTDAQGRFSLEAAAGAHLLHFRRDGYQAGRVQVAVAAGGALSLDDVSLARARGAVHGTLLVEGRPSDASGVLVTLSSPIEASFTALTDRAGAFRFAEVPVGRWSLDASLASYEGLPTATVQVSENVDLESPAASAPAASRTLMLRRDATISGAAVLTSGAPAQGVEVELNGSDLNGAAVGASATSLANGSFSLPSLPEGTYRLSLFLAEHEPVELGPVALAAGATVTLATATIERSRGDAAGQFLLAGAASHESIRVRLAGTGAIAGTVADALTDGLGRFGVIGLPVGIYDVQATKAPDWTPASGTLTVSRNQTGQLLGAPVSLQVISTASVSGTVTVDKGLAAGAQLRLRGEDLRGAAVDQDALAAADGSFRFPNLVAGSYQLTCERANYETWSSSLITVASGAAVVLPDVTLRIARGALVGSVRLAGTAVPGFDVGTNWAGVRVSLEDETGAEVASTISDAAGGFRFPEVAAAATYGLQHRVKAVREHFSEASMEAVVPASGSVSVGPLVLELQPGSMTGHAFLHDNVGGAGRNPDSTGIAVSVTGVAYNGVAFSKAGAESASDGAWSLTGLPPGTFEVRALSTFRRCEGGGSFPVRAAQNTEAGESDCYDTVAPQELALGAVPAWSNEASLLVALVEEAVDQTANLRGYQYVRGRLPNWDSPEGLSTSGPFPFALQPNVENTLWVRAIDWLGNPGPASYVTVRQDGVVPSQARVLTPREYLSSTTTSVSLTGAEGDSAFDTYLACSAEQAAASPCPAQPSCTTAPSASSFALSLTSGKRTCIWAQGRDLAGNVGPVSAPASVLCDLSRPQAPQISPVYEASAFTARAKSVDIFVTSYSLVDLPLSGASHFGKGIDHLEIDSGAGFVPLCPQCRSAADPEVWDPCASGCDCDSLVQCASVGRRVGADWVNVPELRSLRVPLVDGTTNRISVRAVDLAGNLGDGASISVAAEGMRVFAQGAGTQGVPRFHKGSVAFVDAGGVRFAELDASRTPAPAGCFMPSGPTDYLRYRSCESQSVPESLAAPGDLGLVVIAKANQTSFQFDALKLLAPGAACPGGVVTLKELPESTSTRIFGGVAASGRNLGWVETEDWESATRDEKEVFTCQLDDCLLHGKQYSLGAAAGAGHMASLRAGGDYLLWAASATADCPNPKYRWKLAYVSRAPSWSAAQAYRAGAIVWPTSPNGHAYLAQSDGTSGALEPVWPTGTAATVADGELSWKELSHTFEAEQATLSADGKLVFTADNTGELAWAPSTVFSYLQTVRPSVPNGFVYMVWTSSGPQSNQGLSGQSEPVWPTTTNATVVDGELTWFALPESSMDKGGNPPAIYRVHEVGPDRLWGSADDTAIENRAIGELAEGGLAIEAGRAVAISSSFDRSITVWDADSDGSFKAEPAQLRHLVAKGGEPRAVELDQGLLVYSYGSDLVATDLSTLRWESAMEWEEFPVVAEDGTILFRRGGAEEMLVARTPEGVETAGVLPGYELNRGDLGPMLVGKDVVLPSLTGVDVLNAGADGRFFTADDPAPVQVQAVASGMEIQRLTVGGGNAAWTISDGSVSEGYVLLGAPGESLSEGTPVKLNPTGPLMPYTAPAITETFVAWMQSGGPATLAVQYLGGGEPGAPSDIDCSHFAAMLGELTWCSGAQWQVDVRQLVASGQKLLIRFLPSGETRSKLVVLDPGPNGRFGASVGTWSEAEWDDRIVEVPLGELAIEQEAVAMGGDSVAFAASAPGLSAQLYSWRPESGAVLQRTFHFSEKRNLQMATSGRIVWSDTLFDSRSVFVWLP